MNGAPLNRKKRSLPRRKLKATFAGKVFLLLVLGVGIAATQTGNNMLYLALSLSLSLVLLSGVLSEATLRGIDLSVRPVGEAYAGSESFLAVHCSASGKRFPACSLVAILRFGGKTETVRFPDIPPGGAATRTIPIVPNRRGPVDPIPIRLSTHFPFSLFEKSVRLSVPARFLVYPLPLPPVPGGRVPPVPASSGDPGRLGRTGPFPRGIREHLPADPLRDIHWKASARTGRWIVKEREGDAIPVAEIHVPDTGDAEEFETRLSVACGAVLERERFGDPYRLRIGSRLCAEPGDPDRRRKALESLAGAQPAGAGNDLRRGMR